MAYRLRLAKAEQIPAIRDLFIQAFTPLVERLEKTMPANAYDNLCDYLEVRNLYILMDENQLVGAFMLTEQDDCIYVERIAVLPGRQKEGLGHYLLREIELIAESRELPFVRLHTPEVMDQLVRFYLKFGFVETHRAVPDDGRDTFLRVHFEKEVARNSLHMDHELEHDRQLV